MTAERLYANGIFTKRYARYLKNINSNTIEKYFGLKNRFNTTLKFILIKNNDIEEDNKNLTFNMYFVKKYKLNIKELPAEINKLIMSYADVNINITFNILHTNNYPFSQPIWSLINITQNLDKSRNILEYILHILNNHNNNYIKYWSPATDIEKDILEFIRKISHFDLF